MGLLSSFRKTGLEIAVDDIESLGLLIARWLIFGSSSGDDFDDEDNEDDKSDNDGDVDSDNDELDSSFVDSLDSCNMLAPKMTIKKLSQKWVNKGKNDLHN